MRLLFFILLLANAIILGYFLLNQDGGRTGAKAHPPLHAEAIRLASELPREEKKSAPAVANRVCLEWSGLTEANYPKAQLALEALGLKGHVVLPATTDFWVYIPPQKSKQDAEKKIGELKSFGVEDGTIVEDAGKWRYAISLAAFASKEESEFYLKQLRDKGIRSAKVVERRPSSMTLTLVDIDSTLVKQLDELKADYGKSEIKTVACSVH